MHIITLILDKLAFIPSMTLQPTIRPIVLYSEGILVKFIWVQLFPQHRFHAATAIVSG